MRSPTRRTAITVTEFATQASSILTAEAELFRGLDAPDDVDDDHRALIANDEVAGGRLERPGRCRRPGAPTR